MDASIYTFPLYLELTDLPDFYIETFSDKVIDNKIYCSLVYTEESSQAWIYYSGGTILISKPVFKEFTLFGFNCNCVVYYCGEKEICNLDFKYNVVWKSI